MEYRYNFGLSYYYDSQNIDSAKEADHLLVDYSYEILSHPLDYCNLSAEVNFSLNPFINVYSLSMNLKGYLGTDFSGLFLGFSPFSECNFGNLFLESPFLNYAVGFFAGYNKQLENNVNVESKGAVVFSVYDRLNPMKIKISLCFCFC